MRTTSNPYEPPASPKPRLSPGIDKMTVAEVVSYTAAAWICSGIALATFVGPTNVFFVWGMQPIASHLLQTGIFAIAGCAFVATLRLVLQLEASNSRLGLTILGGLAFGSVPYLVEKLVDMIPVSIVANAPEMLDSLPIALTHTAFFLLSTFVVICIQSGVRFAKSSSQHEPVISADNND